jgi:hypothetical protein
MRESQKPNNDRLEEAIGAFRRMTVPEVPPAAEILAQLPTRPRDGSRSVLVSFISKRRLLRLMVPSAAAVLVLLGSLGLFLWNSTSSFALADVIEATRKYILVRYKLKQISTPSEGTTRATGIGPTTQNWTVFADLQVCRFRKEMRAKLRDPDDPRKPIDIEEVTIDVIDGAKERILTVKTHPGGNALPPRKAAWLGRLPNQGNKPLLDELRELQRRKGVTSGKATLDGRDVITFRWVSEEEIKDATVTTTLWIEPKTKLPVRHEQEIATKYGTRMQFVATDYEWDPELPKGFKNVDELFSTTPPEGYALDDRTKDR